MLKQSKDVAQDKSDALQYMDDRSSLSMKEREEFERLKERNERLEAENRELKLKERNRQLEEEVR